MSAIVGIDLGTTYSAIAVLDETGKPTVQAVDGERIVPSCVCFPPGDMKNPVVGQQAKHALETEPETVVQRFKLDMDNAGEVLLERNGVRIGPIDASAMVLKKMIQEAEKIVGPIQEVVVTVPANFAEKARKATIQAGREAGVEVKNIVNEPTAAVLAYATQRPLNGTVLVYDLGGGTFDVTIAKVEGQEVTCLTSEGDTKLGGVNLDRKVADLIDEVHKAKHGESLRELWGLETPDDERRSPDWQRLLKRAEELKRTLSVRAEAPFLIHDSPKGMLEGKVSREEFERSISSLIGRTEMLVETALENVDMEPSDIDEVLLVGGSTRVPAVRESLKRIFGRDPSEGVNPDEAVALGAAVYAGLRAHSSRLNAVQRERISNVGVTDVANQHFGTISLGVDEAREVAEQTVSILIKKDTALPCSVTERFFTASDSQQYVNCRVTQSAQEEEDPQFVMLLYEEKLGPLPAGRPSGCPIDITFSYNLDQTMDVRFVDVKTGESRQQSLGLDASSAPSVNLKDFVIE